MPAAVRRSSRSLSVGVSQTQALAGTDRRASAVHEAGHFYPHLLVDGWRHEMDLSRPDTAVWFPQIAYDVRPAAVGLVRLFEATGDARYAVMAGLAASWFTGGNAAGVAMYDPAHGYGFDGLLGPGGTGSGNVNRNAGAESTIEALMTILEVERHPEARRWLYARGEAPVRVVHEGKHYAYRIFSGGTGDGARGGPHRVGYVMNQTAELLDLLEGPALKAFTQRTGP